MRRILFLLSLCFSFALFEGAHVNSGHSFNTTTPAAFNKKVKAPTDYAKQGYDFLVSNARTFHDFTQLSGDHASTITVSEDLTANNRDLINNPSGYTATTPTVFRYRYPDLSVDKTLYSFNNNPLLFATGTTNNLFATSHEVHLSTSAKSKNFILRLCGIESTQVHYAQIETSGKITVGIKRAASTTVIRTVDAWLTPTVQNADLGGVIALGFEYGFTPGSEFVRIRVNNVVVPTELVSGTAVASWDGSYNWNNTFSTAVGAIAAAVNTTGNSKPHWTYKYTVTPPLTTDQRNLTVHQMLSTDPQSGRIVLLGDSELPFCTATKTYYCPVYLDKAPPSNVIVTVTGEDAYTNITGTSLTFTPSNYNVPQMVSVVADANQGYQPTTLTFTATGGFTETKVKNIVVTESRTGTGGKDGSDVYLTDGYNATRFEANAISLTDSQADALREAIKLTIFKGNYPSGAPTATTTPTSYGGVTLANANAGTKTRHTFSTTDGGGFTYNNFVAHVRNTAPVNKLFFDFFGHGESFHQEMYNQAIATGYDWAGAAGVAAIENTHNNPNLTGSPSWLSHDQLFTGGVDTETFDARSLFLYDKIRFLQWIQTQYNYTHIVIAGVSGGGWMATMIGSMLEDVDVIFEVRGCNSFGHPESGSDLEQGNDFLAELTGGAKALDGKYGPRITKDYRQLGYLVRMVVSCSNGADFHQMSHELDPLGGANYIQMPYDIIQNKLNLLGGGNFYQYINKDAAQSTHGYNTNERAYIISHLP
jgi:hypothetical protein